MKKLAPLLFLLALTVGLSAKTNRPNSAAMPNRPHNASSKMNTNNPLGGPPPIPSSMDGLGPPPAVPLGLDLLSGSFLLGLASFGIKKLYYNQTTK